MKLTYTLLILLTAYWVRAQTSYLRINPGIILPKDSVLSNSLINSLNDFLLAAQKPNEENKFVFEGERVETFVLLDEIKGIEKSGKLKDDFFYKAYLSNVVPLKDSNYLVQVTYAGVHEGVAMLRACFELIAHKGKGLFTFSSPLLRNTKHWKVEKTGNNIFHYQHSINKQKLKEFGKLTASFDAKLRVDNKLVEYYCAENMIELQRLVGVLYKADYNGRTGSVWASSFGDRKIVILGNNNASFDEFDPHDLFHDRLGLVISRSKVNKPVDEGCAYLYGGSWGLSWKQIFKAFTEQVASNKNISWMDVKETPLYFKAGGYEVPADYIVNALLIQLIEKEKGFSGVWELLNVGPFEKGNEKYYQVLEKVSGISKADYNNKVWELINAERQ